MTAVISKAKMIPVLTAVPTVPSFQAGTVSAMNTEELTIQRPPPNPNMNLPTMSEGRVSHI